MIRKNCRVRHVPTGNTGVVLAIRGKRNPTVRVQWDAKRGRPAFNGIGYLRDLEPLNEERA